MPIHKVLRQFVLLQTHIDAELVAGFQIVEIQAVGDVLPFNVIEICFEFPALKEFADGRSSRLPLKLFLTEEEVAHILQWKACLVCLRDGGKVIAVSPRQGEFLSVESNPFAEGLVLCDLFKQGTVFGVGTQTEFQKIFRLRILFVDAVWQVNQYTITIESNGGTEIAPITQDYGTIVQAPVVTRSGYAFVEWYADSDFTEVFNFATMPAENVTVYAKWQMSNLGGELTGIRTAEELMAMSGNLAGNYYLENDIDMSGCEWVPVGTKNEPFTGSFDGKNFAIKSLTIRNCNLSYAGFFGYSDGEIKNIFIAGNYSGQFSNVGGIAGYGAVTNCHWSGHISTKASGTSGRIGGIVGEGSAYQCSASGSIASVYVVDYCGGIVGYGDCVENCYSNLTINGNSTATSSAPAFGGLIAGRAESVENCLVGESAAYRYKKYGGWDIVVYPINRISGSGSIQHSFSYTDDAEKLQSRDYMVNTAGWDESIWCFGYGLPVFYGTDYIRVIYENCQGANNDENPSAYQVGSDGFMLAVPYRTGYTFNGWYLDENFENEITEITPLSEPLTIYAKWTPNSYTITLNPVGGELETVSVQVDYGGEYQLPVPYLLGYDFVGWYNGTGQTAVAYTDNQGNSLVPWTNTEALTLYAKYTARLNVIIFNANGGTGNMTNATGYSDLDVRLPANAFVRDGYAFIGWATSPNGELVYYDRDIFPMGTNSSYTLYAIWRDYTGYIPISSAEDLLNIKNELGAKYYLTCDIDMAGMDWKSIGTTESPFTGIFDGNGHIIYNLSQNSNTSIYSQSNMSGLDWYISHSYAVGLFGVNSGQILNLTLLNTNISIICDREIDADNHYRYSYYAGILCGQNYGTIDNCYVQGNIYSSGDASNSRYLGGVAGTLSADGIIKNTVVNVSIKNNAGYSANINDIACYYTENIVNSGKDAVTIWQAAKYVSYFVEGLTIYQRIYGNEIVELYNIFYHKPGYTFGGWALEENGEKVYDGGDEFYFEEGQNEITLYPVWLPHKIVFDPNGGSGVMEALVVEPGTSVELPNCSFNSPNGYYFVGWSTEKDGEAEYTAGQQFTIPSEDIFTVTLYAVWTAIK